MYKYLQCVFEIIETAINVGYSCQLLTDEMVDVFIVDGTTADEVQQQLQKFRDSIRIVNTFQPRSPAGRQQMGASNGGISGAATDGTTSSMNEMGIVQHAAAPAANPPAVSVVTFRWDDETHTRHGRSAR